jgi:cell division protein FtsW (lipid II flippase)
MVQYLLLGYIVLYAVMAVGMFSLYALIVPSEEKKDDKTWETPLDIVLALIGLAGMLLLYLHFEPVWLKLAWVPVSIALAITQVWLNLRSRRLRAAAAEVDREAVRATDLTTILFLAPSLLLNFLYAFR